ncbi:fructose-6-phosphate aldolase [Collinsella sp. AGMB00827]|uniref:Fructose-6-phosphate aldolase n=1 Tax=Collinsella ureilytica TaxID=2869515 RepID=A0ABS7MIM5_9ACTN|nr:transaldolase family protein [Collinsella urealyticum]MBY4797214.1 fructose-6-phosphate aldolase [Collinsella urealyticum]
MKLCIDDADVEKIRRIYERFPVDGVSTNPSILAASGRPPYEVLHEIRSIIGDDGELFVQVISNSAEGMLAEAKRICAELGASTLVKVPSTPEGFRAMRMLKAAGIRFIGTAIYTAMQGFLAAKCGAEYAAPYVNRIDNMGFDGVKVACEIHDSIVAAGLPSGLLAASFKNSQQVLELVRYGVKGVTVAPDLIEGLVKNAAIDAAVDAFTQDFETLVGTGATMADC